MSITIDRALCIGCGRCAEACPGNLIALDDSKRAAIRIPEDCWGCTACMKECPAGAIRYFLGADIGGAGSLLSIRKEGSVYRWTVTSPNGSTKTITVDRRSANRY